MPATTAAQLTVRPMRLDEVGIRIGYFHDVSDADLARLGIERGRLLSRAAWCEFYAADFARPLPQRENYLLVWELDGEVVGMSHADQIAFGDHAFMHIHILDPGRRHAGLGAQFVRRTATVLFADLELARLYCQPNAFNVAPNRTLQRAGFRYVFTRELAPRPTDFAQPLTRWELTSPPR